VELAELKLPRCTQNSPTLGSTCRFTSVGKTAKGAKPRTVLAEEAGGRAMGNNFAWLLAGLSDCHPSIMESGNSRKEIGVRGGNEGKRGAGKGCLLGRERKKGKVAT